MACVVQPSTYCFKSRMHVRYVMCVIYFANMTRILYSCMQHDGCYVIEYFTYLYIFSYAMHFGIRVQCPSSCDSNVFVGKLTSVLKRSAAPSVCCFSLVSPVRACPFSCFLYLFDQQVFYNVSSLCLSHHVCLCLRPAGSAASPAGRPARGRNLLARGAERCPRHRGRQPA